MSERRRRIPLPVFRLPTFRLRRRSTAVAPLVEEPSAQLQEFLVELGSALLSIGTAARDIQRTLQRVAVALGSPRAALVVFPTLVFVGLPGEQETRFEVARSHGGEVRFDRASRVYEVVDRALAGAITAPQGIESLKRISAARPRFTRLVRVIGHGLAAAGVALVLLGAQPLSVVYALALGMLVGGAKLSIRPGTYASILFPVVTSFLLALAVFAGARTGVVQEPLQVLIPPLVTLVPGAVLTTGFQELATGDMVSGSSRLGSGIAQLLFLAFGILSALGITGVPAATALQSTQPALGALQPWLGVLLFSVGVFLYYCGPRRSFVFVTLVLLVAYGAQLGSSLLVGGVLSGFFGAGALTLVAYLVQSVKGAPPAVVCFLPAFWLLVPGATGLIRLTQTASGVEFGLGSLANVVGSILAITLGVLVGTGLFRWIYTVAPARWRLRLV